MVSKCTWKILLDLGSDHLPISITIPTFPLISSISRSPSFNYNKARCYEYLSYIDTHCPPPSSFTTLSLSKPTHTFTKLLNDTAASVISFSIINRPAKAWWSPKIADAVAKRRKSFAMAHCSKEDCQNYITILSYTSTVISKAKAELWQKTCSSVSSKTRPSEVFSLLHSISDSSSSSSNFPSCHTSVDCVNQLFAHIQSHFSIQTPKFFSKYQKSIHD